MSLKKIISKAKKSIGKGASPKEQLLNYLPANAVCAEIGVWKGKFSRKIVEQSSPKMLHLIDPWAFQPSFSERMYGGRVAKNQEDMDAIFTDVQAIFSDRNNVRFSRNYSDDAVSEFTDEYFDWVYIDGNHHYDNVLADLKNYFPKVRKNGFVAGDDYLWSPREAEGDLQVKRAVADFLDSMPGKVELAVVIDDDQFALKKLV